MHLCSSGLTWEKFLEKRDWSAADWEDKFKQLKKRNDSDCALKNIHHVSWSKKLLQKEQALDLHGTELCSSIKDLVVLLPLGASIINKLDLR